MKIFLSILLISTSLMASAQQNWKIKLHRVLLLSASQENEATNIKKINPAQFNKNGSLEITYIGPKDKSLVRSIFIVDENDGELLRKDGSSNAKFSTAEIKKIAAGKNKLRIFTTAIPRDPELAARVRVRRVHLCTLELK